MIYRPTTRLPNNTKNTDSSKQVRVACVGDSLTEISGYPNYLSQIIGNRFVVGNFGVCGSNVLLDSDNPYKFTGAFRDLVDFHPNLVVTMLGTNDANPTITHHFGNFVNDYLALIEAFQTLESKPKVLIVKPPPIFSEILGLSVDLFNKSIIPAFEEIKNKTNLTVIDIHSALRNEHFFMDGVHPTEQGAKVIAEKISEAIWRIFTE